MNRKGQALIEAVILSGLTIVFFLKLIQLGLELRYEIIFDDLIERNLICQFQKQADCNSKLRSALTDLHFQSIEIRNEEKNGAKQLTVSATSRLNSIYSKKSELCLDLSVP